MYICFMLEGSKLLFLFTSLFITEYYFYNRFIDIQFKECFYVTVIDIHNTNKYVII